MNIGKKNLFSDCYENLVVARDSIDVELSKFSSEKIE